MHDHHRPDQQQPEGLIHDLKTSFSFVVILALIWSYPMKAWTRRAGTCGSRFFGNAYAVLGVLFWPVFCILVAGEKPDPLQPYAAQVAIWAWGMTLIALVAHRIKHAILVRQGLKVHSMDTGRSWVPGDPWKAKGTWEPAILFALGGLALTASIPLGLYLFGSAVAQSFVVSYHRQQDLTRIRQMEDARIEAEYYAELRKQRED